MLKQDGTGAEAAEQADYEIVASVQTDRGCVREANEDSGRYTKPNDRSLITKRGSLLVVADGMGGHASGEVASGMAVELVSRLYYEAQGDDPQAALKEAVEEANRLIYAAAVADEKLTGMGTTCTALALRRGAAYSAHVGDSRIYLRRGGRMYLMTEDHSAVMEMVRHGVITAEEARRHEDKNVILRALGTSPEVEAAAWEKPFPLQVGDQFLLCSDGLHDLVGDEEMGEALARAADPHEACEQLIALAKGRGGHDNITVSIVSVRPLSGGDARHLRATREVEAAV
jgi:PPM family protein phosphatase